MTLCRNEIIKKDVKKCFHHFAFVTSNKSTHRVAYARVVFIGFVQELQFHVKLALPARGQ
jgi:hypothetical protein